MKNKTMLAGVISFTMILALLGSAAPQAVTSAAASDIGMSLNGQTVTFSSAPEMSGSTLMVPLRDLSVALGVTIQWNSTTRTASASKDGQSIELTAGSLDAKRGNEAVKLEASPYISTNGKMMIPLRFFSESFDFNVYWDHASRSVAIHDADTSLPTVGSLDRMKQLLADSGVNIGGERAAIAVNQSAAAEAVTSGAAAPASTAKSTASAPAASPEAPAAASDSSSSAGSADYSGTNVQVEGVDEADIIKTDGKYIYQVNRSSRQIIIADAVPATNMKLAGIAYSEDRQFNPQEMYVDDDRLVIVGQTYVDRIYPAGGGVSGSAEPAMAEKRIAIWPNSSRSIAKAVIFDISDKSSIKQIREIELDGQYVSSRKIGSALYLIANKSIPYYQMMNDAQPADPALLQPSYRDSADGDAYVTIGYQDIRYFPKAVQPNYLLVGGIDLDRPEQKMEVESYLGSGANVYASPTNLYISVSEYEPIKANIDLPVAAPAASTSSIASPAVSSAPTAPAPDVTIMPVMPVAPMLQDVNTVIYKFGLSAGRVEYKGRGKVPGTVLNQFSMDEHDGFFRIATTKGDMWRNDQFTSKNNMYVLNESMSIVGLIEDIAPGEQIYSVRYTGDRAYMVTFKKVDPLFVIDLSNPQKPNILGKLKIPGYSDYLHPYDENHVIGFGKDAVEVKNDWNNDTTAYYQGMKLALFDVSDVNNPKELFTEMIGDRGTDSELLYNHKALLFSKEKNLLAFPVTLMEVPSSQKSDPRAYGEFAFQGVYVYSLNLNEGFQLRGKVTHMTEEELLKAGQTWVPYERTVERALYIGDTLYTASQGLLKANQLSNLQEIGTLPLPIGVDR